MPAKKDNLHETFIDDMPLGAILLILFGAILLLHNFGILSGDFFVQIWRFWPVIFIFAGIKIMTRDKS